MIFPSVRYAGLNESPHSETQCASSIAMWAIPHFFKRQIIFSFCKTSGFARITRACPHSIFRKFSSRSSCVWPPLKTTHERLPSCILLCWSAIKAKSGYITRVGPSKSSAGVKKHSDFPAPVGKRTICFPRHTPSFSFIWPSISKSLFSAPELSRIFAITSLCHGNKNFMPNDFCAARVASSQ